jgi:cell wall-associated NlpC family hydrolase
MLENDGSKFKDEYKDSIPVQERWTGASIENLAKKQKNWTFYFNQQWGAYGDAFVVKNNNKFTKQKDFTGHAALGGQNRSTTLEAALGRKLGWEENRWFTPVYPGVDMRTPGKQLYRAVADNGTWAQLGVRGATLAQYKKAHDYGQKKKGAPYNWLFQSWGPGFYCSELVAFAWRAAGIDIIPQKKTWNEIWPMDLYDSARTYTQRGIIL